MVPDSEELEVDVEPEPKSDVELVPAFWSSRQVNALIVKINRSFPLLSAQHRMLCSLIFVTTAFVRMSARRCRPASFGGPVLD